MTARESKTPVTVLQEYFSKMKDTPTFNLIHNGTGTHTPLFTYEVVGLGHTATGSGKSKKEAKHESAKAFLEKLKIQFDDGPAEQVDASIVSSPYAGNLTTNAVGELSEYCLLNDLKVPVYELTRDEGLPHAKIFAYRCSVSSFTTEATERTKKQAKHRAAQDMLVKLKSCLGQCEKSVPVTKYSVSTDDALKLCIGKNLFNTVKSSGLNLRDYYTAPKSYQSPTLDNIKSLGSEWNRHVTDKPQIFRDIMGELAFDYCDYELPPRSLENVVKSVFMTALVVKSSPEWTFYGEGPSPTEASEQAIMECLKFLIDLS